MNVMAIALLLILTVDLFVTMIQTEKYFKRPRTTYELTVTRIAMPAYIVAIIYAVAVLW